MGAMAGMYEVRAGNGPWNSRFSKLAAAKRSAKSLSTVLRGEGVTVSVLLTPDDGEAPYHVQWICSYRNGKLLSD